MPKPNIVLTATLAELTLTFNDEGPTIHIRLDNEYAAGTDEVYAGPYFCDLNLEQAKSLRDWLITHTTGLESNLARS